MSQSEAGLAGTAGGRWGATGTPAFSGITMLDFPGMCCGTTTISRIVFFARLEHWHWSLDMGLSETVLNLLLLHLQDTYLNQLLSEEEEPVWVIYTNKKSLLGSEACTNNQHHVFQPPESPRTQIFPRPILRHPVLSERAEIMQLLNMPYLTKQASWLGNTLSLPSVDGLWRDNARYVYAQLCCAVRICPLSARFGPYSSDQQMPWRDTGENCSFGLEKAQDEGLQRVVYWARGKSRNVRLDIRTCNICIYHHVSCTII